MNAKPSDAQQAHLVLVNIGNTNVSLANWHKGQREAIEKLTGCSASALAEAIAARWDDLPEPRAVVIGSVVPQLLTALKNECAGRKIEPLWIVGENMEPPIGADLPDPTRVGTDRLCAAAAAYAKVKGACVVADLGTATTIDLVSDNGVFLGGTIVPGMKLCARALHEHTAQLPLVEEVASAETLGKDTVSAIRNGVFAMMCGALREITERYATDIGKWPPLILTGGDARAVADACDFVDALAEDLSLDGLALAYQLTFGEEE